MVLSFTYLDVEKCSPSCCYDAVSIYDGPSSAYQILAKVCGNTIPSTTVSSRNQVYLSFTSDGSVTRTGFRVEVKEYKFGNLFSAYGVYRLLVLDDPNYQWATSADQYVCTRMWLASNKYCVTIVLEQRFFP